MNDFIMWWRMEGGMRHGFGDEYDSAEAAWNYQENKICKLEEGLKLLPKIEPQDRDRFISRLINYGGIKQVMSK